MKYAWLYVPILMGLFLGTASGNSEAPITVSGSVLDAETGQPIAGAKLVSERGEKNHSTGEGRFQIANVPLGERLTVSSMGYETETVTVTSNSFEIRLDPKVFLMDEMVVTATRIERRISDSPALTEFVHEKELRENAYEHMGEVLDDAPGLYVNDDPRSGVGYAKSLNIQGMDRRRILVLVDGRPVFGNYAGRIDMATFGVGGVERVEVVKGPSSSLYGSGAIGGVVNIITQKAHKSTGYATSLVFKADPNWNSTIHWSHRFNLKRPNTTAALSLAINTRDGYYLLDDDENVAHNPLSVGYNIGADIEQTLTPDFSLGVNGQLTLQSAQKHGLNRSSVQNFDLRRYAVNPSLTYRMGDKTQCTLSLYTTRYKHESYQTYVAYGDRIKELDALESRPFKAVQYIGGFDKGEEIPGLKRQNEDLTRGELVVHGERGALLWVAGGDAGQKEFYTDNISGGWKHRKEQSLFGQIERQSASGFSLLGGLRYEHSDAYGSDVSPKLAISRKQTDVLRAHDCLVLRASVAKGYRAPDFKELYYELPISTKSMAIIGGELLRECAPWEPRLKPEVSVGVNAGPEYFWMDRIHVHANLFWNELWDALQFTSFDTRSETYRKMVEVFPRGMYSGAVTDSTASEYTKTVTNVARVRTHGAELFVSIRSQHGQASVSYTRTYAKDITNKERLENKPSDMLKLKAKRSIVRRESLVFGAGASYRFVHGEWGGEERFPDQHRLDGHLFFHWKKAYKVTVGVQNITDHKSISYLRQLPGRRVYVTNNLSF